MRAKCDVLCYCYLGFSYSASIDNITFCTHLISNTGFAHELQTEKYMTHKQNTFS